jgi:CHAT domain-containing protein
VGAETEVLAEMQSLRFMMRRLARGRGAVATAVEIAKRLDHLLFGPLRLGETSPLLIIPTPDLHALPWFALPTCRDRSVVISPSGDLWHQASRQDHPDGDTLLAAGPDLTLADAEVSDLAAFYPGAKVMSSQESDVDAVQSHLDGAGVAHIASHAFFQYENPMFSSLRLADGDLYVYDIERLSTAPGLVVLSACDSGFTETHAGDELMGLSSALLSMGTKTIIASVGLVPDSAATKDLMVSLHRGLVSGLSPSEALHRAQVEAAETPEGYVAASSFICIGAG